MSTAVPEARAPGPGDEVIHSGGGVLGHEVGH